MITLSKAFKMCDITKELVYLRHIKEPINIWNSGHCFTSKAIREKFDMQKIKVIKIELEFEHFGSDFKGWRFVVCGIDPQELIKNEWR